MSGIGGVAPLGPAGLPAPKAAAAAAGDVGFGDLLGQALREVDRLQDEADRAGREYSLGRTQDIAGTLITIEKANLAVQLTLQIRNRLVDAYQEVMRMPL